MTARLSKDNWADGAIEVLVRDGVSGIKINTVCEHLGVTRGSFYWHFADLAELNRAMAERWCDERREVLRSLEVLHNLPAIERLRAMVLNLLEDRSYEVERALREWARKDEAVAAVLAEGDLFVFSLVEGALLELGERPDNARVLAGMLVYAGIGFAQGLSGLPRPTADEVELMFGRLLGR